MDVLLDSFFLMLCTLRFSCGKSKEKPTMYSLMNSDVTKFFSALGFSKSSKV